jgi:hypothetical protein
LKKGSVQKIDNGVLEELFGGSYGEFEEDTNSR